jgi:hypothetical protein
MENITALTDFNLLLHDKIYSENVKSTKVLSYINQFAKMLILRTIFISVCFRENSLHPNL